MISRYDKHYSITIDRCEVVTPMLINNSDTDQWQLSFLVFSPVIGETVTNIIIKIRPN